MRNILLGLAAWSLPALAFTQNVRPIVEIGKLEGARLSGAGTRPLEAPRLVAPSLAPAAAMRVFEVPRLAAPVPVEIPRAAAAAPPVVPVLEAPKPPEVSPMVQLQELARQVSTLENENAALKLRLEDQSRFVKSAVHDLNNPLSILHGNLYLLDMKSEGLNEGQRKSLDAAMKGSRRLAGLVESILEFEKAAAADAPLKRAPVELSGLLRETAGGMSVRAAQKGVRVEVDAAPGDHIVSGDAELIRRLVENFISNGIKYNKDGGRLIVSVKPAAGGTLLSFSDEGIGIKASDIPKIFGPFFRTDEARTSGASGNGLGLAGARAIARRHGGEVEVESEPGRGTTFRVFLPSQPALTAVP